MGARRCVGWHGACICAYAYLCVCVWYPCTGAAASPALREFWRQSNTSGRVIRVTRAPASRANPSVTRDWQLTVDRLIGPPGTRDSGAEPPEAQLFRANDYQPPPPLARRSIPRLRFAAPIDEIESRLLRFRSERSHAKVRVHERKSW